MKKLSSYIITFICILILLIITLIILLKLTLLNEKYIIKNFDDNYYSSLYTYVQESFESYILQSGLNEDVIKNIISQEQIKQDTEIIIKSVYSNEEFIINTEAIKQNLLNNINEYLKQNNITLNSSQAESVNKFVELISTEYESQVAHTGYLNTIINVKESAEKSINMIQTIAWISFIVIVIILVLINRKKVYNILEYVGVTFLSNGLIFVFTVIVVNIKTSIEHIFIFNDATSNVIKHIIQNMLGKINLIGIIYIILGIILIILKNKFKFNIERKVMKSGRRKTS